MIEAFCQKTELLVLTFVSLAMMMADKARRLEN